MPTDESRFAHELEAEVQVELDLVRSSRPEALGSPAGWLFDPADAEREEVGLCNLLGAAEALESGPGPDSAVDVEPSARQLD